MRATQAWPRWPSEYGAIYLRSPGNIGFGRAHNLAYQRVRRLSPFHLVLNPDVHFEGPVLESLLEVMSAQPDLGVVMPKILYGNGATQHLCKRLPTPVDLLMRRFAPGFAHGIFRYAMERYELRDRDYDVPMEPPTLSGCFLLLRNAVVDQVGLFDERFFMYMEDVDLVRRLLTVSRALVLPAGVDYPRVSEGLLPERPAGAAPCALRREIFFEMGLAVRSRAPSSEPASRATLPAFCWSQSNKIRCLPEAAPHHSVDRRARSS